MVCLMGREHLWRLFCACLVKEGNSRKTHETEKKEEEKYELCFIKLIKCFARVFFMCMNVSPLLRINHEQNYQQNVADFGNIARKSRCLFHRPTSQVNTIIKKKR